ncbi:Nif3-like dinuclear metal center hexameric protein [archaeon]|nr:Nif3-like dinuclear metal center hexameric protein [archaeon]
MAKRKDIVKFLDEFLKIEEIDDKYLHNGLIFEGKDEVKKIAFAVDSSVDVIKAARKEKADMIIVHHGFLSKISPFPITNHIKKMVKLLVESDISVYGAHIPLDVHEKVGNNAELCRMFGVSVKGKFTDGYWGNLKEETGLKDLVKDIETRLDTRCRVFDFGKKKIKSVAFVSGGAQYDVLDALRKDIDCFVTGEGSHSTYLFAKDGGINMICAGHYATETLGLKALMKVVDSKFGVDTVFIDMPTGL